jgi:hypothetical protein
MRRQSQPTHRAGKVNGGRVNRGGQNIQTSANRALSGTVSLSERFASGGRPTELRADCRADRQHRHPFKAPSPFNGRVADARVPAAAMGAQRITEMSWRLQHANGGLMPTGAS